MYAKAERAEREHVTVFERYQREARAKRKREHAKQPTSMPIVGIPIIYSKTVPRGEVFILDGKVYRYDEVWGQVPGIDSPRWGEWMKGWVESPLTWEGCD